MQFSRRPITLKCNRPSATRRLARRSTSCARGPKVLTLPLFRVLPENRVIGFVLLPIRPAELGKTTNTTFTTSNNLHASRVLQSCCKVNNKIQGFARTLRQEKSAGNVCPRQALFIVVSLAATLGQHGPRRVDVPAKLFHYMALFLAMA